MPQKKYEKAADMESLYPYPTYRKIAFATVQLASGDKIYREVVVFDGKGKAVAHYPLREEIPFVEWHDGVLVLSE